MLIICQIEWHEVGVAFEMQCFRNCTLSSYSLFCVFFRGIVDYMLSVLVSDQYKYLSFTVAIIKQRIRQLCRFNSMYKSYNASSVTLLCAPDPLTRSSAPGPRWGLHLIDP